MNRIKEVIKEKGINQNWLANQLLLSQKTVNDYCCNRKQPTLKVLYRIAKILRVGVRELLEYTSNFKPELTIYENLTPKEHEVLEHIKSGLKQRQIMDEMKISINTLSSHRKGLYSKLNARTAGRVIYVGMKLGIIN